MPQKNEYPSRFRLAGIVVSVPYSLKGIIFLAVGLLYRQKTKVSKCQKQRKNRKIKGRSDTEMDENKKGGSQKDESQMDGSKTDGSKKDESKNCRIRCKNMMYEQQIKRLPAVTIGQLEKQLKKIAPKKYALIVHDKDVNEQGEPAEDHVHVMMSFENARSINSIAKELGDKPQYIKMWKGKAENGYSYLIHATRDSISKHQYQLSEVKANFNYQEEMKRIAEEVEQSRQKVNIRLLLDSLYHGEISKEDLEKKLSGSQYGNMKRQIEDVWNKSLQFQAAKWREEMKKSGKQVEAIWISGKAGTGKTSLAKEYAEKLKRPYFITGSSKDIFQNYSGEHTMIIDEFRADMIKYPDLLRILDPFGSQVMAPSRYNDKSLACDLIIITSPYNPVMFYQQLFQRTSANSVDSLAQLLRRITLTIEMDDSLIKAVEYDMENGIYKAINNAERKNSYSKHYRESKCKNSSPKDLFDSMFQSDTEGN